ncbi:MAG: CRISPR-associated protein Cas4 [Spirochaetes bacterium GWB1_59_5]|nr:MAG: CRISPR-associated protein Cas4 [Spirochaetes bacterium GWB1_59_5]
MYSEDDLIPISALQHILFCERQFALIHVEQLWAENVYTAEGKVLHERVDIEGHESRCLFKQEFGMALRSLEYGIVGKADLVELNLSPSGGIAEALPVEFKRGKNKENDCDRVQLYAQALCLEEMLGVRILGGSFYYLGAHRRTSVEFPASLRAATLDAIDRARRILLSGLTPPAIYDNLKCDRCSLLDMCMPDSAGAGVKRVESFVRSELALTRKECSR